MVMANTERIQKALDHFRDGLKPAVIETYESRYGANWLESVGSQMHHAEANPSLDDVAFLLKTMKATWNSVWHEVLGPAVRAMVFEVADVRNQWAHQDRISTDDTARSLDSMERILEALGDTEHRKLIRQLRTDLQRQQFEEEARTERRKTAAKPTEGQPTAGLAPWREIITPHADVASGDYEQAEFAADLYEVAQGSADAEYQDPKAFFARTYITEGLKDLLVGAASRLAGQAGDPVIELQTNFGGGKTHSMIALYHLASGVPARDLSGVSDILNDAGIELPAETSRAVIVGQGLSVSTPVAVENDVKLHTLWGQLAYQLAGRDGYELVRGDDEAGTNPGRAALQSLFTLAGPSVILIDEWVAYARQLDDTGTRQLAGGDFDTQFTFAQALTEAAAAMKNVVLLVSIPASDIEVGGDRGKAALEKLKNVVARQAKQWQPASPDESFEIVRRRLFDAMPPENARVRDTVIRAFIDMYRDQRGEFPNGCGEGEYEKRMRLSYPIHPELFDRLFEDWSSLDKFQRTRGVLRLMAIAISQLWQRGDQSLLIMPGTLPMDSGPMVSELKKYLEDGWDPVIKSDIDGENALPLKIDNENVRFGRISATRRSARTVYMASAPRPDGSRGVDIKSIVLGCAQPGEPIGQFSDALKRLSGDATHLYVDGAQYWYSLQANVTRVAADRAASNFGDHDVDEFVKSNIKGQGRGQFASWQVFAEGPGDVPDDDDGVRLVILPPTVTHQPNDTTSAATELAGAILAQRDGGPRVNKNLLVFVAASSARLPELRSAVRLHLAWRSIVDDYELLDLTAHQKRQADSKVDETLATVTSLIAETFVLALTPTQEAGTAEISWTTTRLTTSGPIAERTLKKLSTEEHLISKYGGVRVRMDIDRYDLWSERRDIEVKTLWSTYARFLHLPRLLTANTLNDAISDGTNNISWSTETFGYADAHDGTTWVGVKTVQMVSPAPSGFLIDPAHVSSPAMPGGSTGSGGSSGGGTSGGGNTPPPPKPTPPGTTDPTEFYARFTLDSVRSIRQFSDIVEHVAGQLGADVEFTVELNAKKAEGFDDRTRRVVSENAANLGAENTEFGSSSTP